MGTTAAIKKTAAAVDFDQKETLFMSVAKEDAKKTVAPNIKPVKKSIPQRETAESMASKQKEIAVSEFFAKNRHLLGFDNPRKALLTTVKEAVDNALDACEEAGILPELWIKIEALNGGSKAKKEENGNGNGNGKENGNGQGVLIEGGNEAVPSLANATRFRVTVRDNGPGIVKAQIPNVFGRLLYGSKFHRLRMSRGQQGIGISAAGMYGLITTGQSVQIVSRTQKKKPAHRFELRMDTMKNRADIIVDEEVTFWSKPNAAGDFEITPPGGEKLIEGAEEMDTGTEVSISLEAKFQRGRASVDEYLEQTAISNPHATVHWIAPDGQIRTFAREVNEVPESPKAIKPHPYGVELGVLIRMLKETENKHLGEFLQEEFSRVSPPVAKDICGKAGLSTGTWCAQVAREEADRLHAAIQETPIKAPPTDCLVPIGETQIRKGMLKEIKAEFFTSETRSPAVYRGNPFQIEVGLAYGGQLPTDDSARLIRYANRVPLLYQPSACCISKSLIEVNWRNYALGQPRNSIPEGPLVIFVHMASVWVPFTSESKEAIADYDEIRKEIKLAVMECGRRLNTYIRRRQRMAREGQRRHIFEKYIGEVVKAVGGMTDVDQQKLHDQLTEISKGFTETADMQFDENGNPIREESAGRVDDKVLIIEANVADRAAPIAGDESGKPKTSGENLFGEDE